MVKLELRGRKLRLYSGAGRGELGGRGGGEKSENSTLCKRGILRAKHEW